MQIQRECYSMNGNLRDRGISSCIKAHASTRHIHAISLSNFFLHFSCWLHTFTTTSLQLLHQQIPKLPLKALPVPTIYLPVCLPMDAHSFELFGFRFFHVSHLLSLCFPMRVLFLIQKHTHNFFKRFIFKLC